MPTSEASCHCCRTMILTIVTGRYAGRPSGAAWTPSRMAATLGQSMRRSMRSSLSLRPALGREEGVDEGGVAGFEMHSCLLAVAGCGRSIARDCGKLCKGLLRKKPPCYGKDKTAVELLKDGWVVSASMAGRILSDAKRRGILREPPRPGVRRRNPKPKRPYAVRKPKDYRPARPGDLVQVDTLDVRPLPGVVLKHFTARDVVSRCDVLQVGTQATSASAAQFLNAIVARMPFPVRAIQVDGGSEFQGRSRRPAVSAASCCSALPPHSPKLKATRAPDARRGVLQLLRRGVDDGAAEPGAAGVGGAFLSENRRQSLGWRTLMEHLAQRRLEEAS